MFLSSFSSRACMWLFVAVVAGAGSMTAQPSLAETEPLFDGSKARVNLSGRLTTLSQTISAASCQLYAGIDKDRAASDLAAARTDFAAILTGLKDGNARLGIPTEETFSRVLKSLARVQDVWTETESAIDAITHAATDTSDLATLDALTDRLLDETVILASEVVARYTNPNELLNRDAMAIGIIGREALFLQQMSLQLCSIVAADGAFGTEQDLAQTIDLFDVSLRALRDGLPDAGISPPPNEAIKTKLEQLYLRWQDIRPLLGDADARQQNAVLSFNTAAAEMAKTIKNVATLYMLSTPGQEDVFRVPLEAYAQTVLTDWLDNPDLIAAIRQQNISHANLSSSAIQSLDQTWRAQEKADGGALIDKLLSHPVSAWLLQQQEETAGFVTEVFVMDDKGLNVAQSVVTSDYWQGDEDKWSATIGDGSGNLHISGVEFDDSTGIYQSQVSLPIRDPGNGNLIGAVTFGINVQSLL